MQVVILSYDPKTKYDIYSANHCDMRHLLIYWDKELIHKGVDDFIVLRDYHDSNDARRETLPSIFRGRLTKLPQESIVKVFYR